MNTSHQIDALFAEECDSDLCDAIYHVLHEREASMPELNFDQWPATWVTHWSVWRHYWIWKMNGFESLWMVVACSLKVGRLLNVVLAPKP